MPESDPLSPSPSEQTSESTCKDLQVIPQKSFKSPLHRPQQSIWYSLRKTFFTLTLVMGISVGFGWYFFNSNSLLAQIHHQQIICHQHQFLSIPSKTRHFPIFFRQHNPSMVQIDLDQPLPSHIVNRPINRKNLITLNNAHPVLGYVVNWTKENPHRFLMLKTNQFDLEVLVKTIQKARIIHRTIIAVNNIEAARKIFDLNPQIIVSVPVKNLQEENKIRPLTLNHNLAFYLPRSASKELFKQAHHDAAAVITDADENDIFAVPAADDQKSLALKQNLSADIIISNQSVTSAN